MKKPIRLRLILLMVVSLFTFKGWAQTLLVLGDSLSSAYNIPLESGWVSLMQQDMKQNYPQFKVVNASISGETTGNALKRLPELLSKHRPSVIVIELGGNDGLRGFKLSEIKKNIETMIQFSQQQNAFVVLTGIHMPPNYGPGYTKLFYNSYLQLAEKYATEFVPFILHNVGDNPDLMQRDGIHPKAEAQKLILHNMWPSIESAIKKAQQ